MNRGDFTFEGFPFPERTEQETSIVTPGRDGVSEIYIHTTYSL